MRPGRTDEKKRRVILVDDHPIVREGMKVLFSQQPDLDVVADVADAKGARVAVKDLKPDVVIVDLALGRDSGLALIEELRRLYPPLAILALSMHDEQLFADRALRAGAHGYIMKQEATSLLLTAVRTVLRGDPYVSAAVSARLVHAVRGTPQPRSLYSGLSNRELEVFRLIGMGVGTREIAGQLHISIKTVEAHRAHIKEKLQIATAPELVIRAAHWVASNGRGGGALAES